MFFQNTRGSLCTLRSVLSMFLQNTQDFLGKRRSVLSMFSQNTQDFAFPEYMRLLECTARPVTMERRTSMTEAASESTLTCH